MECTDGGHHVDQKEAIVRELARSKISIAMLPELRLIGSGKMNIQPPGVDENMIVYFLRRREARSGCRLHGERRGC